jgi:hypothetical protein
MLQLPPSQPRAVSWLLVALWALVIFATIPVARVLERAVEDSWGTEVFLWAVFAVIAAAFAASLRQLLRSGRMSPGRWIWLGGVALSYAVYAYSLRENPVEAIHFVQYGVLGAIAFRALSHSFRDASIYPAAALVGGLVGVLDEAIQWVTPGRVWDARDIWFNFIGAAGVQLGIGAGIRPAAIEPRLEPAGLQSLCRIALLGIVVFGASVLNTPPRIEWVATHVPGLGFLLENSDVMLEYGYRYELDEMGLFRSRLPPDELVRIDAERGAEVGRLLAESDDDDYADFLAAYTPITDPFVHEARVHVFRRDRYLSTAESEVEDLDRHRYYLTVAYRENRFLEQFFPSTLRHSGRELEPERRASMEEGQNAEMEYESPVAWKVVTRFGEHHVIAAGAALVVLLLGLERAAARAARRSAPC